MGNCLCLSEHNVNEIVRAHQNSKQFSLNFSIFIVFAHSHWMKMRKMMAINIFHVIIIIMIIKQTRHKSIKYHDNDYDLRLLNASWMVFMAECWIKRIFVNWTHLFVELLEIENNKINLENGVWCVQTGWILFAC